MNSTGKMSHDRNITQWLFITFVSSAAVGKHSHVELAWAGRGEYQEELNPCCSHGSMQTPVRAGNHCCWQGCTLQPRCSSSRSSWLGLTERVRVQPLLVFIPGLQKVHIFFCNSDLGKQERQLQHAFLYIHILDSHQELLVIKKQSNEAGFGIHLLTI